MALPNYFDTFKKLKINLKTGIFIFISGFIFWFIPFIPALYLPSITVDQPSKKRAENNVAVGPETKDWVPFAKISPHLRLAVVVSEDARFFEHFGLDLVEIWHSVEKNLKHQRFARGASTISQQVVKMAFLSREKSLIRKIREAAGALLLEALFSKNDILTWYLNLAEFGDGIYGVRKAAQHYFKTQPQSLSIQQSIHLALVLPSPQKWSSGLNRRQLTAFGHRRFAKILQQMYLNGYISRSQRNSVLGSGNFGSPISVYFTRKN